MKRLKKIFEIVVITIIMCSITNVVFAEDFADYLVEQNEYTEEFKEWQELSDEEKQNRVQPRTFYIPQTKAVSTNPINIVETLAATYESKYDLRNIIPENLVVKNQGKTNSCWTFAALGSLETNLAMRDYRNNIPAKEYDYSERHMVYATARTFLDNRINEKGFGREASDGGNAYISTAYLINGTGAVLETDMPFENNEDRIDISALDNKTVQTQVYDTMDFAMQIGDEDTEELRNAMKYHIKNYGAINAGIHGAQIDSEYYNSKTGAIYCEDIAKAPMNHGVVIVGWDDDYSKDNFNANHRPTQNGAWIIKNSWGDKNEIPMNTAKEAVWQVYENECREKGWQSASEIPEELTIQIFQESGYTIEDGKIYSLIGDNGFMYVSYQDAVIYYFLYGIMKTDDKINYENLYQYDFYGATTSVSFLTSKMYLATTFEKQTQGKEYLNQIALTAPETYTCKVFINQNGTSMKKSDFTQVELKAGSSETFDAGYHTLEFLNPVEITGNEFIVMVEIQGTRDKKISVDVENIIENSYFSNVKVESNKCFWSIDGEIENGSWMDWSRMQEMNKNYPNADTTIKAFTVSEVKESVLKNIEITKAPSKTSYIAGQNFDTTGMVVSAVYSDGEKIQITDYKIENGENLKSGQTSVKIIYQGQTVEQPITVEEKTIESISIGSLPTKTEYVQNKEQLDLTGGTIKATYSDNSSEEISMKSSLVRVSGFNNKVLGKSTITVTYLEKTATFAVTIVEEKSEQPDTPTKVEAENSIFDNMKSSVDNVKSYTFTDKYKKAYITMDVQLNNITRSTKNDSVEYYYYLSSSPNTKNIKNWVKITETQNSTYRLAFTINTNDISNFDEVSKSNNLYLYIKEVAKKGTDEKTLITSSVSLKYNSNPEIYVDGVKQNNNGNNNNNNNNNNNAGNNNNNNNNNGNSNNSNTNRNQNNNTNTNTRSYVNTSGDEDNTVSNKQLPKAGTAFLFTTILVISILGILMYVKYEKIDK